MNRSPEVSSYPDNSRFDLASTLCSRCQIKSKDTDFLKDLAYSKDRSVEDLTKKAQDRPGDPMADPSKNYAQERLKEYEDELKEYDEGLSQSVMDDVMDGREAEEMIEEIINDETRKRLQEAIQVIKGEQEGSGREDVMTILEEYERQGLITIKDGIVKITSKGARLLASTTLERVLCNLSRQDLGGHSVEETGYGPEMSTHSRPYELGDDYFLVDIEGTALRALERKGKIELETEDFQVFEPMHQSRLCVGLMIDESGSMGDNHKLRAAIETSLALAELVRREPKDLLKVFIFSETVKEIPPWEIINEMLGGGSTDIRAAMRAFRKAVAHEKGDKQAYIITDTDPNTEDGRYVGFDKAMAGVVEEAMHYRKQEISLNIIMLDNNPFLKRFASTLARKNLGRTFFTYPWKLGEVLIEDYLRSRKIRA